MSQLHVDCELLKAKQDFMLQICKVTKRENHAKLLGEALMQASMLPLITSDQVSLATEEAHGLVANQLIGTVLAQTSTLFE